MIESFEIKDSRTGSSFFSTDFPNFGLPSGVGKLGVKLAETHRIVSPVNSSLSFESNRQITIHGAESTRMESKTIVWMADNDVRVKSNGSVVLDAKKGVYIDAMRIPLAPTYQPNVQADVLQYKVCVCMPQGKLFRVAVPPGNARVNCARISTSPADDPCQWRETKLPWRRRDQVLAYGVNCPTLEMLTLVKVSDWNSFRANQIHSDSFRNLFPRQSELIRINPKKVFNLVWCNPVKN